MSMNKKRRRLKPVVKNTLFLLVIILLSTLVITFAFNNDNKTKKDDNKVEKNIKKENITVEPAEYRLDMIMVGDALIHDKIYNDAKTGNTYDFKKMISLIKPITSKYDVAYYNQETILGGKGIGLSAYPAFNSPYEVGDAMIDAGFNLVSLATNHTMDRGTKAIQNSRKYWDSKKDVLAVGSYTSQASRDEVHIVKKNNITYTMLNYTYGTNGINVPNKYLVNVWPVKGSNPKTDTAYQNYKKQVKIDIEKVRGKVDVVMVAMHWGIEYTYTPNSYQKDMAAYLSSLGVDIIIGTHPHVVQPIEWIGDTLVIYSLGNFISAHEIINQGNRVGLMASVQIIKKKNKDGKYDITITNPTNQLIYTYYTSNYKNIKVIPFSQMNTKYLANYKSVFNKYANIVKKLDKNVVVQ